jgi:hypothetical protein
MAETDAPVGIAGLRVLDLAGAPGVYGTKLLADLGADVVRIEPPAGPTARQMAGRMKCSGRPEPKGGSQRRRTAKNRTSRMSRKKEGIDCPTMAPSMLTTDDVPQRTAERIPSSEALFRPERHGLVVQRRLREEHAAG